jgi:predicted site-specific integrase-resolvase
MHNVNVPNSTIDKYINTRQAVNLLNVTPKTLRLWDKENKIRVVRTPSGIRRYNLQDIQNILGGTTPATTTQKDKQKLCYARVSSRKQMDDLDRQKDFFKHNYPNHFLVTDVGSGINWKRKGLQTILERAMRGTIDEVVVAHRDRLCRFAFELLEWILQTNHVKLVVIHETNGQSTDQELTDDILSIIHVYSCRKNGKRRYSKKNAQTTSLSNVITEDDDDEVDGDEEIHL